MKSFRLIAPSFSLFLSECNISNERLDSTAVHLLIGNCNARLTIIRARNTIRIESFDLWIHFAVKQCPIFFKIYSNIEISCYFVYRGKQVFSVYVITRTVKKFRYVKWISYRDAGKQVFLVKVIRSSPVV